MPTYDSQITWHWGWRLKGRQQNQSSFPKRGFEPVSITHQIPEETNPNASNPLRRHHPAFWTTWRRPTGMSPHLTPSTSHYKKFSSNTYTCVIHLRQNSALKQHHGSILCSPGGPWGPGCPAGPGNPGGPSPGAPGGPCKPWRPGRPGSPAGRQRNMDQAFSDDVWYLAEDARQGALEAHGQGVLIQLPTPPSLGLEERLFFAASICYWGVVGKNKKAKGQFPKISLAIAQDIPETPQGVEYFSDE